jgi:hypothetical protein
MIHGGVRYTRRRWSAGPLAACASICLILGSAACADDGTIPPGALRFGQLGKIVIDMDTPLALRPESPLGLGHLRQVLSWGSNGAWSLQESISYRDLVGDEDFERYTGVPGQSAGAYAEVITQLNETPGLELDVPELPEDLDPECGPGRTRVTFTIQDDAKGESRAWIRCVSGSLSSVRVDDAGPDLAASRIALAVQLVRDATVGSQWVSPYGGSVAFGTLDRGEDSGSSLQAPTVIADPSTWRTFWLEHAGSRTLPDVDFDSDMVVVGIVGPREEAGDSVEVRRILQIDTGTRTEIVERVPGDFCSPAARTHVPYHIVVAPRTPPPRVFAAIQREEVPCGR